MLIVVDLLGGDLDLAGANLVTQILGVHAVDGAAHGESRAEHFLDGSTELLGERLESQHAGNLNNVIERDVSTVLDCWEKMNVKGVKVE